MSMKWMTALCLLTGCSAEIAVKDSAELINAIEAGNRRIVLKAGTYELSQPLRLGAENSNLELIGCVGARLTRAVTIKNGDTVACLAEDEEPSPNSFNTMRSYAPMCFYDHQWATPARWPNGDWAFVEKKVEVGRILRYPDTNTLNGSFTVDPETAKRMAKWDFASGDIRLAGYWTHDWAFERVKAASFDPAKRLVTLASPTVYGIESVASWSVLGKHRFYAYNVRAEMDEPGEWFYDRKTGKVELLEPEGGVSELRVVTDMKPIVSIVGATNVTIRGIDFEYAAGDALEISDSQNVLISNCLIHNIGGCAVKITGGFRCAVEACEVRGIGITAFEVTGGDRKQLIAANHAIRNNEVHDFGRIRRTYAAAANINGCGNSITGNRIYDAPHTAIFYGGNEMLIEANEIFDVLKETGDAGAVYSGRDPTSRGNVLRFNYIHDCGVQNETAVTMAFYLDDCDCGDSYISNRVVNVPRGLLIGGGQDIRAIGNSFSNCTIGISIDARALNWAGAHWDSPKDPSWQMTRKVKEMEVDKEPWRSRYPDLVDYLKNDPRTPKNISVHGNMFSDCKRNIIFENMPKGLDRTLDIQR